MRKFETRRELYEFILLIACIIFLTVSLVYPLLTTIDNNNLYLIHLFNKTNVEFNGKVTSIYGYLVIIFTYIMLIGDAIRRKSKKKRTEIFDISIKFTVLFVFLFSTMNYVKVIYPDSFLSSFDDEKLHFPTYFYLLFLLSYILLLIVNCFDLKRLEIKYDDSKNLSEEQLKSRDKCFLWVEVALGVLIFSFVSLYFVPFISNYKEFMPEEGFQDILDKRTSTDYYFLALFDKTYSLTLPSILLIWIVAFAPTMIYFDKDNRSTYRLMISMIFTFILISLGVLMAINNMWTIEEKLLLKVNNMGIVFVTLCLISCVTIVVLSSIILSINRKGERHYGNITTAE